MGVDDYATLSSTIGEPNHRALDGHPQRKRLDLFERDTRVKPDATFRGPESIVVAAAVSDEVPSRAVIHADRKVRGEYSFGLSQRIDHLGIDLRGGADSFDPRYCIFEYVQR